jgi:hypothetical protein
MICYLKAYDVNIRTDNGVQEMLSQNMAPWHHEYFKLKETEKTTGAR